MSGGIPCLSLLALQQLIDIDHLQIKHHLQFLAPFSGCALSDYPRDNGMPPLRPLPSPPALTLRALLPSLARQGLKEGGGLCEVQPALPGETLQRA